MKYAALEAVLGAGCGVVFSSLTTKWSDAPFAYLYRDADVEAVAAGGRGGGRGRVGSVDDGSYLDDSYLDEESDFLHFSFHNLTSLLQRNMELVDAAATDAAATDAAATDAAVDCCPGTAHQQLAHAVALACAQHRVRQPT